jgi:rRNA maturation RNase YbeY
MPDEPKDLESDSENIELHITVAGTRVRKSYILDCIQHSVHRLTRPLGHLNVVIVGGRKMTALHKKYLGIAGTTDVLTFDLTGHDGNTLDGDIYISLDQAKRQARDYGVGLNEELARLAVHGVLHLAGFRDKSITQKRQMRWMEDQSLASVENVT